jgi:hypothetical protein
MSDFSLHFLHCQLEGFRDFTHVNDLVRRYILNQGLSADFRHQLLNFTAEVKIEDHFRAYLRDLSLKVKVPAVQEIFNNIL